MIINRRSFLIGAGAAALSCACSSETQRNAATQRSERKGVRLTHALVSVPRTRGVFAKTLAAQGIDVEWIGPFPNHAPSMQAVASDSADFSFGGSSTPAAQAILSGAPLRIVAWSHATPRITSILVLPESGIRTVKDLVGKTVAVNKAGLGEFLLIAALEKYQVPRDRVTVSYLNPPDAATAFASRKIDAWAIWSGALELAEHSYGAQRIFEEGKELDFEVDFGTYLVREEYARREPDTIRKVIAAFRSEAEWVNDNFAEAQRIALKDTKYPAAVIERIGSRPVRTTWSLVDDKGIATLQQGADWLSARGILSGPFDVAAHVVRL